jgi:hypothetical protein
MQSCKFSSGARLTSVSCGLLLALFDADSEQSMRPRALLLVRMELLVLMAGKDGRSPMEISFGMGGGGSNVQPTYCRDPDIVERDC